jgi:hypothetical protein
MTDHDERPGRAGRLRRGSEMSKPKPCECIPCETCGMKHYCNVAVSHPGGWVRCGGCPAEKVRLTEGGVR